MGKVVMEGVMGLDMTTVLILSTSSMECMMTNIIQTSVKKDMVTQLVILRESIMFTFLMEGSNMSSTMLMVTTVVLSWRSHMTERPIILMLFIMEVMVIMDMGEPEEDMDLLDKIYIYFPGPDHTVELSLLVLVIIFIYQIKSIL